jgi:signal transduction histidine kinase
LRFPERFREIGIVSIILIVALSYGIYFFLQDVTENNIKESLFEQQKQKQIDSNKAISQHIASDLDSILTKLKVVANSVYVQQGNLTGDETEQILGEMYNDTRQLVGKIDILYIVDKNDIIRLVASDDESQGSLAGIDISYRDFVNQTKATLKPVFSTGLRSFDDTYRIIITYPIINRETEQYEGLVAAAIPTVDYFDRFGNVYDIKSQYIAALDRDATHLAHSNAQLIGKDFFGEYTQNFTRHNKDLNNLMKSVLSGKPGDIVYTIGLGERLTTGYPIFIGGEKSPSYAVFIVTPTSQMYSQIENILFTQRIETFSLLAITTAAAIILIIFLIKWSSNLNTEVKKRTKELESANKQLKVHDKMQKEFINIAAHELRTPTQAITGYSELLEMEPENTKMYLNPIIRNSKRLQRLSEDILDLTRIESESLKLTKKEFDLNDVISSIVGDYRSLLIDNNEDKINLNIVYEPKSVILTADKERIVQVISNLLSNAIKFTTKEKGTIHVSADKKDSQVIVSVKDTGQGIDSEMLPRLFTKFATKSNMGTGLGLFISKSIVEAHGGKMWAENNSNSKGATFIFTLPLSC